MLNALEGIASGEPTPAAKVAIQVMEALGEILADEPDGSTRTVAWALANRFHANGVAIKYDDGQTAQDALFERICWCSGVDGTTEWEPVSFTADGIRAGIETWVKNVTSQRGVWWSQAAAIQVMVLLGVSPQEAQQAAHAAFAACRA